MLKKERAKEIEIRDAPIRPKKEDKLSDKVNSKITKTSLNQEILKGCRWECYFVYKFLTNSL